MIIRTRQAAWTRREKPEYDSQHQAVEISRQTSAKVPAYCVGLRCWIGGNEQDGLLAEKVGRLFVSRHPTPGDHHDETAYEQNGLSRKAVWRTLAAGVFTMSLLCRLPVEIAYCSTPIVQRAR